MSFLVQLFQMYGSKSTTLQDTMLIGSKTIWVVLLDWIVENRWLLIGQCKCQSGVFKGRWGAIDIFNLPGWDVSGTIKENSQAEESCWPSAQCHCTHGLSGETGKTKIKPEHWRWYAMLTCREFCEFTGSLHAKHYAKQFLTKPHLQHSRNAY